MSVDQERCVGTGILVDPLCQQRRFRNLARKMVVDIKNRAAFGQGVDHTCAILVERDVQNSDVVPGLDIGLSDQLNVAFDSRDETVLPGSSTLW
jgi:hypothetical protein